MSTSIIRRTAWTEDTPPELRPELKVCPYSWVRLARTFLAAEAVVFAAVVLAVAGHRAAPGTLAVLVAINRLDESMFA